jgi:hypothetical protein
MKLIELLARPMNNCRKCSLREESTKKTFGTEYRYLKEIDE